MADGVDLPGPVPIGTFEMIRLVAADSLEQELDREPVDSPDAWEVFLSKVRSVRQEHQLTWALDALFLAETADEVRVVMADSSILLEEVAIARLLADAKHAEEVGPAGAIARARVALLEGIRAGAIDQAFVLWQSHIALVVEKSVVKRLDELLESTHGELLTAAAVDACRELVELAEQTEDDELRAEATRRLASALFLAAPALGEDARVESVALMRALLDDTTLSSVREAEETANLQANLAAALAARTSGDPIAHQDEAVQLGRGAIEALEGSPQSDAVRRALGIAHTNLGLSLVSRAALRRRSVDGTRTDEALKDLLDAVRHFEEGLTYRSFTVSPLDWAYSHINLGFAYAELAETRPGHDLDPAIEHYAEADRGFAAAGEVELRAQALHNLASAKRRASKDLRGSVKQELLQEAETTVAASLGLRAAGHTPLETARTQALQALILEDLERYSEAVEVLVLALESVTTNVSPRDEREIAAQLGSLAGELGEHERAAWAWERAARAAAEAINARHDVGGRFDELHRSLNVFRWAAYEAAANGDLDKAVELMELGRANELRRLQVLESPSRDLVEELAPDTVADLDSASAELVALDRRVRQGDDAAGSLARAASERVSRLLAEVRALPGCSGFGAPPRASDVRAELRERHALVYVVTTPRGSLALIIDARPEAEAVFSHVTSTEIADLLVRNGPTGPEGYLIAQGTGDDAALEETLDAFGELLGRPFLEPLADALRAREIESLTIVPVSVMGLVPIHTLTWSADVFVSCLLDEFTVSFAPSAAVAGACARRAEAASSHRSRLVAVGNPLPHAQPLPGTAQEVAQIAVVLAAWRVDLLTETNATRANVLAALPGATHVHFACHGFAGGEVVEAFDSGLSLAFGEDLLAAELIGTAFSPRLAVASACETGIIGGYEEAEEALSFASLLIGAGAAGSIAALWPINDYATALLMSRMYEELADGAQPAEALRIAQLWLRDLSPDGEKHYVDERPPLRRLRRAAASRATYAKGAASDFAQMSFWAGFVHCGA